MSGNKSILITGGFGNLGSWLVTWFAERGYEVTILSRIKKYFISNVSYSWIECDITDSKASETALSGKNFNYVIHTASLNETFLKDYERKALLVNTLGTRNILQYLSKEYLQHFIYISTFHVYGASTGMIDENAPLMARHDYATTHLFAEYYVKQFNLTHALPFTILRLTNSYGCPKDSDSSKWYLVLNDLARMAFERREIRLNSNGKAQRDFVWMGSVCSAIEQLVRQKSSNDTFNLGSGTSLRILDVAEMVRDAYSEMYGMKLPIFVNENDKTIHDKILKVDVSKLKSRVEQSMENRFKDEAKKIFVLLESLK